MRARKWVPPLTELYDHGFGLQVSTSHQHACVSVSAYERNFRDAPTHLEKSRNCLMP